jgi:hypothetical protein
MIEVTADAVRVAKQTQTLRSNEEPDCFPANALREASGKDEGFFLGLARRSRRRSTHSPWCSRSRPPRSGHLAARTAADQWPE